MLMPKKSRIAIYENLFKEGVMVAKKDWNLPKHPDLEVSNLFVINALKVSISLSSVAWGHSAHFFDNFHLTKR